MNKDVSGRIREIIAAKLGVDASKVVDSARFIDDLGADSLDTVELVMGLEEEFGIEISNTEGQDIQSVGDAVAFVQKKLEC
ncbi:MAG: acyl carrier protein [Holosporaceae bacterium]|jgi:acyl carrier protein|nr:acyl carrier protein [Holosporaceae bacterium]